MDALTEMHLCLREFGWEPEEAPDPGTEGDDAVSGWSGKKRGHEVEFLTVRRTHHLPVWVRMVSRPPWKVLEKSRSVARLRRRLKDAEIEVKI